jgi:hypothetical protein
VPTENISYQNFEQVTPTENNNIVVSAGNPKKKLLFILGGLVFALLVLVLVFGSNGAGYGLRGLQTPTPTPTGPTPTPLELPISSPSAYATDSAVLNIEKNIDTLENSLANIDLKEENLQPPPLDWNINMNK